MSTLVPVRCHAAKRTAWTGSKHLAHLKGLHSSTYHYTTSKYSISADYLVLKEYTEIEVFAGIGSQHVSAAAVKLHLERVMVRT